MNPIDEQHIELPIWWQYVRDELTEQQREQVEEHLYSCDSCLALFMQAVDEVEAHGSCSLGYSDTADNQTHSMPNIEQLSSTVAAELRTEQQYKAEENLVLNQLVTIQTVIYRQRWLYRPVTHYTAAAAITMLLLGSGMFNGMVGWMSHYDQSKSIEMANKALDSERARDEDTHSWSGRMVNSSSWWLGRLQDTNWTK